MGTITGISDIDPVHWPNSHWRSVKVISFAMSNFTDQKNSPSEFKEYNCPG